MASRLAFLALCAVAAGIPALAGEEPTRETIAGALERCIAAIRARSADPLRDLPPFATDGAFETPGVEILADDSFTVMPDRVTASYEVSKRGDEPIHHSCGIATHAFSRAQRDEFLGWFDDWARQKADEDSYRLDPGEPDRIVLHGCFGDEDRLVADAASTPVSPEFVVIGYTVRSPLPVEEVCGNAAQ